MILLHSYAHCFTEQGLKSELEKASPSLGRSAVYVKDSRINGLPRYELALINFHCMRDLCMIRYLNQCSSHNKSVFDVLK